MDLEIVEKISPFLSDTRGTITNILKKPIKQVAIIFSKKGALRGNHYHPHQTQYIYIISGKMKSYNFDLKTKKKSSNILNVGKLVITKPMVAHVYEALEDTLFLNLVPGTRDSERMFKDTIQWKIK